MNKTFTNVLVMDKEKLGIDPTIRKSLKTFYQRNLYMDIMPDNPILGIIETTEDECILSASKKGIDFVIMTWEGNICDIHRYHHECVDFIKALDQRTNGEWLVAGHIMDQYQNRLMFKDISADLWKDSFWLYPITAIVNIKKWKELGSPSWGQDSGKETVTKIIPSEKCVHDTYTPLEINRGEGRVETKVRKGWNIIDASIKAGIPVYNLSEGIRSTQTYLYPEVNIEKFNNFWQAIQLMPKLNDQYRKVLERIMPSKYPRRINDQTWQCFIKNTEDYLPFTQGQINWDAVDTIMLPSSGFKDFIVSMHHGGPRKDVHVIHFDIIHQCVGIRRQIIEMWDGSRAHLLEVLTTISNEWKAKGKDVFHMNSMKELGDVYEAMIPFFKDEQDLQDCWQRFKNFKHDYIEADMLDDPYNALKLVTGKNVYICLSDIAGWRNNIIGYGYLNLRNNISTCIKSLKRKVNGYVDYKDPGTDLQQWQSFEEAIKFLETPIE